MSDGLGHTVPTWPMIAKHLAQLQAEVRHRLEDADPDMVPRLQERAKVYREILNFPETLKLQDAKEDI